MMRVVLDTNVIVSAYLNEEGQPFRILKLALSGIVRLYASEPILAEYQELLKRKSFPLDARRATLLLQRIRRASTVVKPAVKLNQTSDPDDNIFLECAQTAKAHYLVTGNINISPSGGNTLNVSLLPRSSSPGTEIGPASLNSRQPTGIRRPRLSLNQGEGACRSWRRAFRRSNSSLTSRSMRPHSWLVSST